MGKFRLVNVPLFISVVNEFLLMFGGSLHALGFKGSAMDIQGRGCVACLLRRVLFPDIVILGDTVQSFAYRYLRIGGGVSVALKKGV